MYGFRSAGLDTNIRCGREDDGTQRPALIPLHTSFTDGIKPRSRVAQQVSEKMNLLMHDPITGEIDGLIRTHSFLSSTIVISLAYPFLLLLCSHSFPCAQVSRKHT